MYMSENKNVQLRGLTEAIKNSNDLHEFLTKTVEFLKEHCKKINFILQEKGKIYEIKKVGRHKIVDEEIESIPPKPEKYIELDVSQSPRVILYTRPKRKTSMRKLREIVDVISAGVQAAYEREQLKEIQAKKSKEIKDIVDLSTKAIEIIKEISLIENIDESYFEKIAKKINDIFGLNTAIVIEYINGKISIPENKLFEKEMSEILNQIRERTDIIESIKYEKLSKERTLIYPIRKSGNIIGIIGIRSENPLTEELVLFLEKSLNFLPTFLERREKISTREKFSMFDILNKIKTGIAFFSRSSGQKPIFANEKFNEYIKQFPEITSISEREIASSSAFSISTMKEVKIGDETFVLTIYPIYDGGEIMLEVIKEIKQKHPADEIIKEFREILSGDVKICDEEMKGESKISFERIKSKMKILLSLFEDTEESISKILDEIISNTGVELEKNFTKDLKVPYNSISGILQLIISDIKLSNQKTTKIKAEEYNSSILIKVPYRVEDKKTEDDIKFIMRYFQNICKIEFEPSKKEIRIKISS